MYRYHLLENESQRRLYGDLRGMLLHREERMPQRAEGQWVSRAFKDVLVDNPQIFWFEGRWRSESKDGVHYIVPEYTLSRDAAESVGRVLLSGRYFLGIGLLFFFV